MALTTAGSGEGKGLAETDSEALTGTLGEGLEEEVTFENEAFKVELTPGLGMKLTLVVADPHPAPTTLVLLDPRMSPAAFSAARLPLVCRIR